MSALARASAFASARDPDLANDLALASNPSVRRQSAGVRIAPTAGRLLAAAAHLLPASDRGRYAAEFRAELWEIAHAGASRRGQLAYAAQQVRSARRLRAELRAPRRERAVP
jgi:hypothetical protein